MQITYHTHHGSDCDGNGLFYANDTTVDLFTGITSHIDEESAYGQCGNYVQTTRHSHFTRGLTVAEQTEIYSLLTPFIDLSRKYPKLQSFRYFSTKQRYFLTGRLQKAINSLPANCDYHGVSNLAQVFILPTYGIVISIYDGHEDRYSHFNVRVSSSLDDYDLDYWL